MVWENKKIPIEKQIEILYNRSDEKVFEEEGSPMSVKLNDNYVKQFITDEEIGEYRDRVIDADRKLRTGTGEGSDFLGWMTASCNYDRDEYDRIKKAAEKIRSSCDVFIVIGIGGSYLGARAVIEFLKSPRYNQIKAGSPEI